MRKPTPEEAARARAAFRAKFGDNPPQDWEAWRRAVADALAPILEEMDGEAEKDPFLN